MVSRRNLRTIGRHSVKLRRPRLVSLFLINRIILNSDSSTQHSKWKLQDGDRL
jgi:hypothetical protein